MNITRHNQQRGFTLVELMVVIVVIVILASITVVTYRGIQARAQDVAVQATAKQLEQLVEIRQIDTRLYGLGHEKYSALTNETDILEEYKAISLADKVHVLVQDVNVDNYEKSKVYVRAGPSEIVYMYWRNSDDVWIATHYNDSDEQAYTNEHGSPDSLIAVYH